MASGPGNGPIRKLGRYALHEPIASGGMATVHFGRLLGPVGFARTVAIKRLHPHYARDPDFVTSFLDEARLAARIRHPNVVPTIDVVATEGELFLVMEYVEGESLSRVLRTARARGERAPVPVACAIVTGVLRGLQAAHEARSEQGQPLGIVHRDVSPQNVLVGKDGIAHVVDFGVAKAAGRLQSTHGTQLKGKLAYMAPEILRGGKPTPQVDVWAAAVVLWEVLVGERLFGADTEGELVATILAARVDAPSRHAPGIPSALDAVVLRGLAPDPAVRFASAASMADALEAAVPIATPAVVGAWVERMAGDALAKRAAKVVEIESDSIVVQAQELLPAPREDTPTGSESETRAPVGVREEPASHVSSISVRARAMQPTGSSKRRAWWIAAAALSTLVAAGGGVAWRGKKGSPDVVSSAPSAATMAAPAASAPPPRPESSSAPSADAPSAPSSVQSKTPAAHRPAPPHRGGPRSPSPPPSSSLLFRDPG